MRVRMLLQIISGDDETPAPIAEIATLTKTTSGAEDLGLTLAEGKALLAAAQQRIVERQVDCWLDQHRKVDGRRLRSKGSYYPITFRTLFGDVRLKSPRYYLPKDQQTDGPATVSPLTKLIPGHIAPERLYLETKWSSLVPYAAAAELLADVLPVDDGANAMTLRRHTLEAANRVESELAEERISFMENSCPRDWEALPVLTAASSWRWTAAMSVTGGKRNGISS